MRNGPAQIVSFLLASLSFISPIRAQQEPWSEPLLCASFWGPAPDDGGLYLNLCNGDATLRFEGEGPPPRIGKYRINGKELILQFPADPSGPQASTRCTLTSNSANLFMTHRMECSDKHVYWRLNSNVPPGSKRYISGIPVVTLGDLKAITTANTPFRRVPSPTAPLISCVYPAPTGDREVLGVRVASMPYLPSGIPIRLLARIDPTTKKAGSTTWYFVRIVPLSWYYGDCGSDREGWIDASSVTAQ